MNLSNLLQKRYSTKKFDSSKTIKDNLWQQMEDALIYAASSTNAQPWHFIIASSEQGKQRLMKGTDENFAFNSHKIKDSSHSVLFCTKTHLSDIYLADLLEKETQDGRFTSDALTPEQYHQVRTHFYNIHKDAGDVSHWTEKQTYLNIGNAMLGAMILGIDSVPMEGIDINALNDEFDLPAQDLTASVIVCFGYRADDDFNAKLPKSRLEAGKLITRI